MTKPEQRDAQLADLRDDIRGHKRLARVAIAQVRAHRLEAAHAHQAQHLLQRVAKLVVAQRAKVVAAGVHARHIRFTAKLQRERRAVHVVARVDDQRGVGLQLVAQPLNQRRAPSHPADIRAVGKLRHGRIGRDAFG
jgi:hypothetical protein